jgi:PTS system mannose-specific IID component
MKSILNRSGISLPRRVRAEMIIRSLFIQATNNFERMLSLGFLFALWPLIKLIYRTPEARRDAAIRHLSFFNTQPYFANCILGVVAHVELRGGKNVDAEVSRVKRAMMGALGAIGDDLFWAGLMPAAALTALVFYATFPRYALIGTIYALIVYNVFHLWTRIRLFNVGLRLGPHVTNYLRMLHLPRFAVVVKVVACFLLGSLAVLITWRAAQFGFNIYVAAAAMAIAVSLSIILQNLGVRPGICWYLIAGAATLFGALTA